MKIKDLLKTFEENLGTVDIMDHTTEIICSLDCQGMPYSECVKRDYIKFPETYTSYADKEVKKFAISMVKMIPNTYPEYDLDIYIEKVD